MRMPGVKKTRGGGRPKVVGTEGIKTKKRFREAKSKLDAFWAEE